MWTDRTKITLEKKVFRNKKFGDTFFVVYMSKFGGNWTNSL